MSQNHLRTYVVRRFRMEGEPNYVQLKFITKIELKEKYLRDKVRKKATKSSYPQEKYHHRMETFLNLMREQCDNVDNVRVRTIQVFMDEAPESLRNLYLTSPYFTTGLKLVDAGKRHDIINHVVGMPIFSVECHSNFANYRTMANTSKVLVNEALIRNDFEIVEIQKYWSIAEHSIYFLYTVTHSKFAVASTMASAPIPVDVDASSVCEVQMRNLYDPSTSSHADTPRSLPDSVSSTNFPISGKNSTSAKAEYSHKLEEQVIDLRMENDELEGRVEELEDEVKGLQTRLNTCEAELKLVWDEKQGLRARSQEAEQKLADALKEMKAYW